MSVQLNGTETVLDGNFKIKYLENIFYDYKALNGTHTGVKSKVLLRQFKCYEEFCLNSPN